jgi:hypothetical protein
LISGFIIGYIYYLSLKKESFRPVLASAVIAAATVLLTSFYLKDSHNDAIAYNEKVEEVLKLQDKALAPLKQTNVTDAELMHDISTVSQVQWQQAKKIFDETSGYQLDKKLSTHRKLMQEYIELRMKHTDLLIIALGGKENVNAELDELGKQINEKVEQMQQ